MKALLFAVVVFVALTLSAHAEFLVYKGTLRHYNPNEAVGIVSRPCYLVINISTKEVGYVSSYTVKGVKQHAQSDIYVTHAFPMARIDGKTVSTFGYAKFTDFGGGAFANESLVLRGLPVTVTVGLGTTDQQPKTLTGHYFAQVVGILARFEENTLAVTFNQLQTVQANQVNGLTTLQELQALTAL